jgi:hypothetical protein
MPSQAHFELIEAYLNQELSPADRQSFEREIAADDTLRQDLAIHERFRLGLRGLAIERRVRLAHERYTETLAAARPDIARPGTSEQQPTPFSAVHTGGSTYRRWAAAASLVAVMGLGLYAYQRQSGHVELAYAGQSLNQSADQLTKGLPANLTPTDRATLLEAIRHYKAGQYDAVVEQLKIPAADQPTEAYRQYFLGLTYLTDKHPTEAILPLQQAVSTSSGTLRQKADWFLALAYVSNQQPALAKPILTRIGQDKAHPYYTLAQQVLVKIN